MEIRVQKLSSTSRLPSKANEFDAGWDLYASDDAVIEPSKTELIGTDIALGIPEGYVGLIWDRSGMAAKKGIHRFAGVIDSGYRGEIQVCLWNSSEEFYIINYVEAYSSCTYNSKNTCLPNVIIKHVKYLA